MVIEVYLLIPPRWKYSGWTFQSWIEWKIRRFGWIRKSGEVQNQQLTIDVLMNKTPLNQRIIWLYKQILVRHYFYCFSGFHRSKKDKFEGNGYPIIFGNPNFLAFRKGKLWLCVSQFPFSITCEIIPSIPMNRKTGITLSSFLSDGWRIVVQGGLYHHY